MSANSEEHVYLNVGGKIYYLSWRLLIYRGYSRRLNGLYSVMQSEPVQQAGLLNYCDEYRNKDGHMEFYFDRWHGYFDTMVNLMKFGELYYYSGAKSNADICVISWLDELKYWGVAIEWIPKCCRFICQNEFLDCKEEFEKVESLFTNKYRQEMSSTTAQSDLSAIQLWKSRLWKLMDDPSSSNWAKITTIISIVFIVVSTVTLVVTSIPLETIDPTNTTNSTTNNSSGTNIILRFDDRYGIITDNIELVCIIWFTGEYLLRLLSCPFLRGFFCEFMNMIDLIAIMPFYLCLVVNLLFVNEEMMNKLDSIRQAMQLFRVLRVLRILKFARHSVGLQSLGFTLKMSYNELGMLLMFIGMGSMVFSCLVYFAEKDLEGTLFTNILITNWWAIISMTTVGYGDMSPVSPIGRVIGAICCVFGVLIISLPIPIIVSNFAQFYQERMRKENTVRKHQELEIAVLNGCMILGSDNIRTMSMFLKKEKNSKIEKNKDKIKF